jgi:hypothetical protein
MQDASPPSDYPCLPGSPSERSSAGEQRVPRMVIHLALAPGRTLSWRVKANSEIRAFGARVWLTRIYSPYDYWLLPGEMVQVARGERIWVSADGDDPAEVTLSCEYVSRRWTLARWAERWRGLVFGVLSPRMRQE